MKLKWKNILFACTVKKKTVIKGRGKWSLWGYVSGTWFMVQKKLRFSNFWFLFRSFIRLRL